MIYEIGIVQVGERRRLVVEKAATSGNLKQICRTKKAQQPIKSLPLHQPGIEIARPNLVNLGQFKRDGKEKS